MPPLLGPAPTVRLQASHFCRPSGSWPAQTHRQGIAFDQDHLARMVRRQAHNNLWPGARSQDRPRAGGVPVSMSLRILAMFCRRVLPGWCLVARGDSLRARPSDGASWIGHVPGAASTGLATPLA